jgi:hypothetical protein
MYSVRYYPRFHVTAVGRGTYCCGYGGTTVYFFTVAPNIFGPSDRNFLQVTITSSRILRPDFFKISSPLLYSHQLVSALVFIRFRVRKVLAESLKRYSSKISLFSRIIFWKPQYHQQMPVLSAVDKRDQRDLARSCDLHDYVTMQVTERQLRNA